MSERCETCRFWRKDLDRTDNEEWLGECCRHAPALYNREYEERYSGGMVARWPLVFERDWCGEWETKGRSPELAFYQGKHGWGGTTGLTVRARKTIIRRPEDVTHVDGLTPEVLRAIKGCGPCTANEIIAWRDETLGNGRK